ncbi:hypothetical protein Mapa_001282 [Marchantia paleacea]|nr:hypothetical protein Mapa_001282 [Marchantia paleacea]
MKLEHRREIGICRGVARRERSHASTSDGFAPSSKVGRWQRSHDSVFMCCSFIFIFFAVIITVSYFFEPAILVKDDSRSDYEIQDQSGIQESLSDFLKPSGPERHQLQEVVDLKSTSEYSDDEHVDPTAETEVLSVTASQIRRMLVGDSARTSLVVNDEAIINDSRRIELSPVQSIPKPNVSDVDRLESGNPLGLAHDIKIFVYELPPEFNTDWLSDARCSNHLFAAEVAIHQVLLKSPLRTLNPEKADLYFVPVYVSCNFNPKNGFPSLSHAPAMMKEAVNLISTEEVYWNRSGGRDHIFVAAHDYGACFHAVEKQAVAAGIPKFLQNSILLQTFGRRDGHPCQEVENIQIPPYVAPQVVRKYATSPPENRERDILAHFRGKLELHPRNVSGQLYSKGVRTRLWQKFKRDKRFFLRRKRQDGYQSEMLRSVFCLAPLGWAPWSPRIVEAVMYGCVPVIIADSISLPNSHMVDWPSISLTVGESDVDNLRRILLRVVATNLTTIQHNLWQEKNRRALLYTQPLLHGDATWQIFNLLSQKISERKFKRTSNGATAI